MERVKPYRIVHDGTVIEAHAELLDAMRRARRIADANALVLDIRNDEDVILVVVMSANANDRGLSMPRAVRHNNRLALAKLNEQASKGKCPATRALHDWQVEPPQHRLLFRCAACRVLGYQVGGAKTVAHKCSACGEPATAERVRKVHRYRWSCDAHVDL